MRGGDKERRRATMCSVFIVYSVIVSSDWMLIFHSTVEHCRMPIFNAFNYILGKVTQQVEIEL